jgi:integrase
MKGRPITLEEFERMLLKVESGLVAAHERDDAKRAKPNRIGNAALENYRQRQIEAAKGAAPKWRHLLTGLWLSGLRLEESLELSWDRDDKLRVDFQPGELPMLRIPGELEKGNTDRLLPMAPEFAEFLQQTPEAERAGYVFNPTPRSKRSARLGKTQVGRIISMIGEKAGVKVKINAATREVKYASAHDLRRSFGLRWASRVMPQVFMVLERSSSSSSAMPAN